MIAEVLKRKNLYKASRRVMRNKGSSGIDGMTVTELPAFLEANRDRIITSVLNHTYVPEAILGVEIPKGKGKTRLLGIPIVTDRWLQQAVSQVLATKFELGFEEYSYGFRREKNIQQAVTQALENIPACRQAGMMAIRTLWTLIWKGFLTRLTTRYCYN